MSSRQQIKEKNNCFPGESTEPEEEPEEKLEDEPFEEPDTYKIISVEDSPELFPFLVEQFFHLKEQFPSMCEGTVYVDVHNFCRKLILSFFAHLNLLENFKQEADFMIDLETLIMFKSSISGTFAERLLVMVRCRDLKVVAGITFCLIPNTSSIYVGYMITDQEFRGHGFMKVNIDLR